MVVFVNVEDALNEALELAQSPEAPVGPNPRVGAVVLDSAGNCVGRGFHLGAGTAHAEVVALTQAGARARGGTIIVTLEPCNHTGRTGPCTQAIIDAGISHVVFAMSDPNPIASGGAQRLREAGIDVMADAAPQKALAINEEWVTAVSRQRPWVTLKMAMSKDGKVSAPNGAWFTSEQSRADVHRLRSLHQAIIVGTGTVLADNPALTVRYADIKEQPLRVVVGRRDIPAHAQVRDGAAQLLHISSRDPHQVLATLWDQGRNRVMLESGPTVARAWLSARMVDEVVIYLAPMLFGSGPDGLSDGDLIHFYLHETAQIGPDVRLRMRLAQG